MRGFTILIATILTAGYGFAAHAAMTADRAETMRRIAGRSSFAAPTPEEAATRVWYGGMLPPVTVVADAGSDCPAPHVIET
ncbi:MAG: hypothetical protein ACREMN_13435 [Gemmatimonadales bacterium]